MLASLLLEALFRRRVEACVQGALAEEFFHHYNQTGDLCMTLQHGVEFDEYFPLLVVGRRKYIS